MAATYFLSVAGGETPDEAYSQSGGRSVHEQSNLPFLLERGMLTQRHVLPLWISAVVLLSFPVARVCYAAYKGKEHRLAEQRKKKLDAVARRMKQTQMAMLEALKRRYAFSDADVQRVANMVGDAGGDRRESLKEAMITVLQERKEARQNGSGADDGRGAEDGSEVENLSPGNTVRKSVTGGVSHAVRISTDKISHAAAPLERLEKSLIHGTKSAARKADDIMHMSPVGKITDAVGHAGKAVIHNTAGGLAAAGKGFAASSGVVAGKVINSADTVLNSGNKLVKGTRTRVKTVSSKLKLGHAYNDEDLDALDDDDLIDAVTGSFAGLVMGEFMSGREVEDADATLPSFSVANEQELLVNTHDNYNMDAASTLLDLQRSFRDTLYKIDRDAADRLQPKLASVHKEDAGGEKMTMQRMSLAIGVVSPHNGQPLTNMELLHSLRPEISDTDDPRRGGKLAPIERKKPLFMAP